MLLLWLALAVTLAGLLLALLVDSELPSVSSSLWCRALSAALVASLVLLLLLL